MTKKEWTDLLFARSKNKKFKNVCGIDKDCLALGKIKTNPMKTIIFQSEKKAKVYEIRSAKNQGCYKANELIYVAKTDRIDLLTTDVQYEVTAKEVNRS